MIEFIDFSQFPEIKLEPIIKNFTTQMLEQPKKGNKPYLIFAIIITIIVAISIVFILIQQNKRLSSKGKE